MYMISICGIEIFEIFAKMYQTGPWRGQFLPDCDTLGIFDRTIICHISYGDHWPPRFRVH